MENNLINVPERLLRIERSFLMLKQLRIQRIKVIIAVFVFTIVVWTLRFCLAVYNIIQNSY